MGCCRTARNLYNLVTRSPLSHSVDHHSHNLGFSYPCNFPQCFILLLSLHQLSLLYLKFKCLKKELFHSDLTTLIISSSTDQPTSKYPRTLFPSQITVTMVDGRKGQEVQRWPKVKNRPGLLLSAKTKVCKLLRAGLFFKSIGTQTKHIQN